MTSLIKESQIHKMAHPSSHTRMATECETGNKKIEKRFSHRISYTLFVVVLMGITVLEDFVGTHWNWTCTYLMTQKFHTYILQKKKMYCEPEHMTRIFIAELLVMGPNRLSQISTKSNFYFFKKYDRIIIRHYYTKTKREKITNTYNGMDESLGR